MHAPNLSIPISIFFACAALAACDPATDEAEGLAIGLHAVVVGPDGDLTSNELEVSLGRTILSDANREPTPEPTATARIVGDRAAALTSSEPERFLRETSQLLGTGVLAAGCELQPSELATIDGNICWTSLSSSVGSFGNERSLTRIAYMTPKGIYSAMIEGTALVASTDLVSSGISIGAGCAASPTGDTVDVSYLASLLGISISTSFALYTVGISTFYTDTGGLQRAYQYDTGISRSISLFPFFSFGFSMEHDSGFLVTPTRIDGGTCNATALGDDESVFANKEGNPFEVVAAGLAELQEMPAENYRDAMLVETANAALPAFAMLANTSGSAPQNDLPAANHADLSAAFFARGATELCANCSATSLDDFLYRLREDTSAVAGDGPQTQAAVERAFAQYQASTPDAMRFAITQRAGSDALRYANLAHADLAAELRGDGDRFISAEILEVEALVGEAATITITAAEIAALVGATPAAIEGAIVTIDGSPRIEAAGFELENGSVEVAITLASADPSLFIIDVDLTTAVGPFVAPTEDWVVRPAMRRVVAKAGPPAQVTPSAPRRSSTGGKLALTAFVSDEYYAPVSSTLSVQFYDGNNALLGEAPLVDGTAQLVIQPSLSVPAMDSLEATTVTRGQDETFPGYEAFGTGFSRTAVVYLDERQLDSSEYSVVSSTRLLISEEFERLSDGPHTIELENPDRRTTRLEFVVERAE